jgi:hypothetical protein
MLRLLWRFFHDVALDDEVMLTLADGTLKVRTLDKS